MPLSPPNKLLDSPHANYSGAPACQVSFPFTHLSLSLVDGSCLSISPRKNSGSRHFPKDLVRSKHWRRRTQSSYVGLSWTKTAALQSTDTYGEMNDGGILAPVLKRTSGATGMKRKKNSVESATTSSMGHACSLCHNKGHKKNKCPRGAAVGVRLTEKTWSDKMALVPFIGTIDQSHINPVVPIDARALQIIGKVNLQGESL